MQSVHTARIAVARPERKAVTLSVMQRALKVLSFLAIVGAVDLSITARVLYTSGHPFEPLQLLCLALTVIFSLLLGIFGLRTGGDRLKVSKLFLIIVLAVWVNLGSVLLLILTGDVIVSVIVNALIVAAFAYVAHRVSHDPIA